MEPSSEERRSSDTPNKWGFLSFIKYITVEPIAFCFMMSYGLQVTPINAMWIDKICLVELNLSHEICDNATNTPYENEIERLNANYLMYANLIELIPAVVYSVFLAAWSDKYGRKFQIMASLIGCLIFHVGLIINDIYMEVTPPYAALLMFIPKGVLGGMIAIFIGMMSYVTDITSETNRLFRLMILEFSVLTGTPIGVYLGGYLFGKVGYIAPHVLSAVLMFISLFYTYARVDNRSTDQIKINEATEWKKKVKDFFDLTNVKECIRVATQRREDNKRMTIWLMYFAMCFFAFPYIADNTISYLFTRKVLNWSPVQYSVFSAINMGIGVVGTLFLLILTKSNLPVVKHPSFDSIMGAVCGSIRLTSEIVMAFTAHTWMLYLGAALTFPSSGINLPIRTILTKSVEHDESGQVLTVLAVMENTVSLITSIIYPKVYSATLDVLPGTPYLLSAGALVIVVTAFGIIMTTSKRRPGYQPLE